MIQSGAEAIKNHKTGQSKHMIYNNDIYDKAAKDEAVNFRARRIHYTKAQIDHQVIDDFK